MYMIQRSSPLATAVCIGDFGIRGGGGGEGGTSIVKR